MKNKTLGFGKYKNKKLEQIAIIDPNYIFWLLENKIINISNGIQELASENISLDPMPPDLDMVHEDWGDRD